MKNRIIVKWVLAGGVAAVMLLLAGCTSGGGEVIEPVPTHVHAVEEVTEAAPTCVKNGVSAGHRCSDCGAILDGCEILPATGHTPQDVAAIAPTCVAEGCSAGHICSRCGTLLDGCEVLAPLGHDWQCLDLAYTGAETKPSAHFVCSVCSEEVTEAVSCEKLGVPILYLRGSYYGATKTQSVYLTASYDGGEVVFDADVALRIQGNSSAGYSKYNFNMWLYKPGTTDKLKIELADGWGKENKYCLKANYVDVTQARNLVSADIWGDFVRSREDPGELANLVNGGAVDGFPIMVCLDNRFFGLYTLNIPKDNWLFDFSKKDGGLKAMLFSQGWEDANVLKAEIPADLSGWQLEFCSTEQEGKTDWVRESFNRMIRFVNEAKGDDFREGISRYIDLEAAIDVMLYVEVFAGADNSGKNIIWVTYDGVKWIPSVYDMDDSWGLVWNGKSFYASNSHPTGYIRNRLFLKLTMLYRDEIRARYAELRESFFSKEYVIGKFEEFIGGIPPLLYELDAARWSEMPSIGVNNLDAIRTWVGERFDYMDAYMKFEG